jgi:hypothetical protein
VPCLKEGRYEEDMRELAAAIIGIIFSIAFVVFFAMDKIPAEVFCSVVTGAVVWFFKEREIQRLRK